MDQFLRSRKECSKMISEEEQEGGKHSDDEQEINAFLEKDKNRNSLQIIGNLHFQNKTYRQGDDIKLRKKLDQNSDQFYGKILLIARTTHTTFPIFLVAWYYSYHDPIITQNQYTHVGKKQLIASSHHNWQYTESIKGKIKVKTQEEYLAMSPTQRADKDLFCCRSVIGDDGIIDIMPPPRCHCLTPYNLDTPLASCILCGTLFHASCVDYAETCSFCP